MVGLGGAFFIWGIIWICPFVVVLKLIKFIK